jgi:hypothetical protein
MTSHAQANLILDEIRAAESVDDLDKIAGQHRSTIELMKQNSGLGVRVIHIRKLWELRRKGFKYGI